MGLRSGFLALSNGDNNDLPPKPSMEYNICGNAS
jgi:hypothetical protein